MAKNLILGPILAQILIPPNFFFMGLISTGCLELSLAIIICKFKENVWSKLKKIAKTLILGLI